MLAPWKAELSDAAVSLADALLSSKNESAEAVSYRI